MTGEALREAVERLAAAIKRDANDDWTAHSEAADMGDTDAANLHGEAGEIRDDIAATLRALLANDTTRAHTAADEFAAEFGHAHPWVAKIRALGDA